MYEILWKYDVNKNLCTSLDQDSELTHFIKIDDKYISNMTLVRDFGRS